MDVQNKDLLATLPGDIYGAVEAAPSYGEIIDITDVASISGMRGRGKSALLYFLLQLLANEHGMYMYAWGIPPVKQPFFHEDIEHFQDLEDIDLFPHSVIGLDEIHLGFDARSSMAVLNKRLSHIMTFTRQRNQILIMATLNNALIDINTFRITNPVLIYKRVGKLQASAERQAIKPFTLKAANEWDKVPRGKKGTPQRALEASLSYVISDEYEGWIANPVTSWWSEDASEMHNFIPEQVEETEAYEYLHEYERFLFNKVARLPVHEQFRKLKSLKKTYPLEKYYLDVVLPRKARGGKISAQGP